MSDTLSRAYTPSMQFIDENGKPLVFGFLCTYKAGTNTPLATYNDNGQLNPVKIALNELGSPENGVQLDVAKEYKFVLLRADGTTVWIKDNVKAAGVGSITVNGLTEIVAGSDNVHVEMSQDGESATISVDKDGVLYLNKNDPSITFLKVKELIDSKRNVVIVFPGSSGTSYYTYSKQQSTYFQFASVNDNVIRTLTLKNNDTWEHEITSTEIDDTLSTHSTNPVENRVVAGAVNSKQDQIPQEQLDEMTDQEIDDLMASLN